MTLPQGWKEEPLGKYFEFQPKSKRKAGEGKEEGKYKFFTSSDIQKKYVDEYDFEGESLIFGTGGGASIHYCDDKFSTSTDCFIVKVKPEIKTRYAYYSIRAHIHLLEAGFKGAGLKHVSKDHLREMTIKFPTDVKVQEKIIKLLEKAEQIKDWRKEADGLSKDYLKSVFVDMFGDPAEINKNWDSDKLGNLASVGSGKRVFTSEIVKKGIPFYRGMEIGILSTDENVSPKLFITKEHYEELKKHTGVPKIGDLLFPSICPDGRVWRVNNNKEFYFKDGRVLWVHLDKTNIISEYLHYALILNFIRRYPEIASGSTFSELKICELKNLKILVPPQSLQEKFSILVKKFEEIYTTQKNATSDSENLFNSLMQKVFKGELL